MKVKVLALVALALLAFSTASIGGSRGEGGKGRERIKTEKNLEDVKRRIRDEKARISSIMKKEGAVLGEVERVGKLLSDKREEIRKVTSSLEKLKTGISETERKISRLDERKAGLSGRLKARLRGFYKMRKGEVLNAFAADDLSYSPGTGRRHKSISALMDYDTRLLEDCEATLTELAAEKRRLRGLYAETEKAKESLLLREDEARAIKEEKLALLESMKREKDVREKVLKELEEAAEGLKELIKKLQKEEEASIGPGGFASLKGRLIMPVEGAINSRYGKVEHPKFKTITFNNGIVISAPVGEPVRSVYDGVVAYTGWLKGYGQIMIIDHGGGFYTLFAHLDKVLKQKGEKVVKAEEVALVGDSGPNGAPGLYFEIREKGVPRDPVDWFASK